MTTQMTNGTDQDYSLAPRQIADVTDGVRLVETILVNLYLVGTPGTSDWVLVDTRIPGFAHRIAAHPRERFGEAPPKCVILTHGHFDHVGSLSAVLDLWDVPVYAPPLELPYLKGQS